MYRLDQKTYRLKEVFRNKVETSTFIKPKLYEFDKTLSVLFYIEQELNVKADNGTTYDATYINTVEMLNYANEDKRIQEAETLTTLRRYQFYTESEKNGTKFAPPIALDVYK